MSVDVSRSVTNYEIAPDGSRALFGARGDVFTVPGEVRPDAQPHAHARRARARLEVVARRQVDLLHLRRDRRGRDLDRAAGRPGRGGAADQGRRQLQVQRRSGRPTARRSRWSDRKQRLQFVDVDTQGGDAVVEVARRRGVNDYAWSPDSKWIAYAKPEDESMGRIFLYSLESKQTHAGHRRLVRGVAARSSAPTANCCSSCRPARSTRPTVRPSSSTSTATCRRSTSSRWRRTRRARSRRAATR